MAIEVRCQCGRSLKAKDEHAGMRAKCPACAATIVVPKASPDPPEMPDEFSLADLESGIDEDPAEEEPEDPAEEEPETTLTDVLNVLNTIASAIGSSSKNSSNGNQHCEYKVITQKDKWFSGKFDPEKVEGVLNSYAKQGWIMKGVATASVPGFGGQRDEIVIIMER
jgi:hypothetical protein